MSISSNWYGLVVLVLVLQPSLAWSPTSWNSRRGFLTGVTGSAFVIALIPDRTDAQPAEFQNIGTQAPVVQEGEIPFVTLESGVKIKDINPGSGDPVAPGARVSIQCSGRLLNLNGVVFYNTKNNNPDGFGAIPLSFTIGKGEALPGLEMGILGMRKNGVRRIIVPADLAYSKFPNLEPKPMTDLDQRALDSVVKNPRRDATILFDVKLERSK
ncbi:FKBP-type peptidyl-prolyl cis-trans isomerase [Fragilaria crotonensis]|nr:FKBP-type peptidyl-prolyl cis-trans isomerase [Fragilaria crotonensis]